jgi:hypothetical protein
MGDVMRWPVRSAVVVLAGVAAALFFPAPAGIAGVARAASAFRLEPLSLLRGLAAPFQSPQVIVGNNVLASVFCTSGTNCWSVGSDEVNDVTANQALHFNGRKWSPVTTPSPGGTAIHDRSVLAGVRCTSAANCWAVGNYDKDDASLSQALHWNGRKWSLVATPDPGGTLKGDFNDLFDVVCTSAVNCWADGDLGGEVDQNEVSLNLVLHWNGKNWSHVKAPNPAGRAAGDISGLEAIRCGSVTNCWGVGSYGTLAPDDNKLFNEVLRWNGKKWLNVTVPSPGKPDDGNTQSRLNALSCTSAKNCWAVGLDTGTNRSRNETLHWNGQNWQTAGVPNPASGMLAVNALDGVSCTADTNCWAVGRSEQESSAGLNEAVHWTGHKWILVPVPQPDGTAAGSVNFLSAVRCVSATNCWAVGDTLMSGEPEVSQILHWTGKKWLVG